MISPMAFIKGEVQGLFGSVFCDSSPEFTVLDADGEDPHSGDFLLSDLSKVDRPPLLHLASQALYKFLIELGYFFFASSEEDAQKLMSIVTEINDCLTDARLQEIDQKFLRNFAFGERAVLNLMAAMFGGIIGQEVVKAYSVKFQSIFQFFYFDSVELLPIEQIHPDDPKPLNSRYDARISVSTALQQRPCGILKKDSFENLDSYCSCFPCRKPVAMRGTWRKQLVTATEARRVDILCQRLSLSYKILVGIRHYMKTSETPLPLSREETIAGRSNSEQNPSSPTPERSRAAGEQVRSLLGGTLFPEEIQPLH